MKIITGSISGEIIYMKMLLFFIPLFLFSCNQNAAEHANKKIAGVSANVSPAENPYAHILDIPVPKGYWRVNESLSSFGAWLRQVELKKDKTVYKYDGTLKGNQSAQFAVLNISVGHEDLQQCADAVMRLRAEYLFAANKFEEISFSDNDGKQYRFTQPYTRAHFMPYLNTVFGMCGSASLSKQLKPAAMRDIQPGDVLIKGGFPGHAVLVMDVAQNAGGKKIYLLAQSYMPAQDIHILINPMDEDLSPWYEATENKDIYTPEYFFKATELRRW